MSLAINTDHVTAVLLTDGWHDVTDASFDLDAYEYVWAGERMHAGGNSGICATGFSFKTLDGDDLSGPLTAIQAVRHRKPS